MTILTPQPPFGARLRHYVVSLLLLSLTPAFIIVASSQKTITMQVQWGAVAIGAYLLVGYYAYNQWVNAGGGFKQAKPSIKNWRHGLSLIGMWLVMLMGEVTIAGLRMSLGIRTTTQNEQIINNIMSQGGFATALLLLYIVCLAPVVEEIIFRGLLMKYFFRDSVWWANIVLSGVVFGLPHVGFVITNLDGLLSFCIYAFMGIGFAFIYKQHDNLLDSITVHVLNNAMSTIPILYLMFK